MRRVHLGDEVKHITQVRTVEPNNGHIGTSPFVHCRKVVLPSEDIYYHYNYESHY